MSAPESNNALSSSSTSGTVYFKEFHTSLGISNDGASAVTVRVYQEYETPATITTTTAGAVKIPAGRTVVWNFNHRSENGHGYGGFSHICAATETSTLRWKAK